MIISQVWPGVMLAVQGIGLAGFHIVYLRKERYNGQTLQGNFYSDKIKCNKLLSLTPSMKVSLEIVAECALS